MGMAGGQPGPSGPMLADIGKGRVWRFAQAAVLERLADGAWREVARYREAADAGAALDDRVGAGEDPETLRIVFVPTSRTSRVALIAAVVIGVLILAAFAYILFVGA